MSKVKKTNTSNRVFNIIHKPISTEKSTNLNQFNQYSFVVSKNSKSSEIKEAIQRIFKVKVVKVNTSIMRGKLKTFKGSIGYKKDFKKAIVTLAEGNTIDSSLEIK
jgi:large subunit ribosomal protein L23